MNAWCSDRAEMAFGGKEESLTVELIRGAVVEIRGDGVAGRRWSRVNAGLLGERARKRGNLGRHPRTKNNL
jgi:hypothetical protein